MKRRALVCRYCGHEFQQISEREQFEAQRTAKESAKAKDKDKVE